MTYRIGVTGSMGMGKSVVAQMFAEEGCDLWDADAAVHRLYARGGAAVGPVGEAFPDAVVDGEVSRDRLREAIHRSADAIERLEGIVHGLVAQDRAAFLARTKADIAVLEIPLLLETGLEREMDLVVCVTAAPEVQMRRLLDRGTMTADQVESMLGRQMPDSEKRRRADRVIVSDTLENARRQVREVLDRIREGLGNA